LPEKRPLAAGACLLGAAYLLPLGTGSTDDSDFTELDSSSELSSEELFSEELSTFLRFLRTATFLFTAYVLTGLGIAAFRTSGTTSFFSSTTDFGSLVLFFAS